VLLTSHEASNKAQSRAEGQSVGMSWSRGNNLMMDIAPSSHRSDNGNLNLERLAGR